MLQTAREYFDAHTLPMHRDRVVNYVFHIDSSYATFRTDDVERAMDFIKRHGDLFVQMAKEEKELHSMTYRVLLTDVPQGSPFFERNY